VDGSTVYAGGSFTFIGGAPRNHIAALDRSTGMAASWDPSADSYVHRLLVDGSTLYAGGQFTTIGGAPRTSLAAISTVTGAATSWNPDVGAPSSVTALAIDGMTLYLGGDFISVGGLTRNRLAAVDASTGSVLPWDPDANSSVEALVVDGSTVYVGGWFDRIGLTPRNRIAAIDGASGLPTPWNPDADDAVFSLAVEGTTVYAGGTFTAIGGAARSFLAALDASTGGATPWDPAFDGGWMGVLALAVDTNTLYAGGLSSTAAGQLGNGLAAFSVTRAEQVTSPSPNGAYATGQAIPIEVVFSGNVVVTGSPRLILQTGELDTPAPYTGGSGTGTLTFTYTVASTDVSNDLDVVSALALDLNGGTLSDSAGSPVSIQLPPPFHNGSLSANKDFVINGGYPATPVITSPPPGSRVNTSTPILAGTADPSVLVLVFIGSASIVSVQSDGAGAWSLAVPLAEGPNTLTVAAGRFNGPMGPMSSPFSLTVDTLAPTVQILSPADGSFTDASMVALSGVTEAGARVVLYDGPVSLGTVTASSTGSWSFVTSLLAEGSHPFGAVAIDAVGHLGPFSAAVTVTVDRTPPAAPTIGSPADGTTTTLNVVTLAGTGEAGGVAQVFDGPTLLGGVPIGGAGTWAFSTAPLPNGTHRFTVQALDAAGNVSGLSSSVSVTVNAASGPSIAITSPTTDPTHVASAAIVDLGGTATDGGAGAAVSWTNQTTGASGPAAGTTVWSASVPLTGGTNVIVLALSGTAGTATDVIAVDYTPPPDVTAPTLTITVPASSPATALSSPVTIQGTAGDDTAVSFVRWSNAATGGAGVAAGTTAWTADVPVVPGTNPITITAFDSSGNATALTATVNLVPAGADVTPPTIAVTDPTTSSTITSAVNRIRIGGVAADETLLVAVDWSNAATGDSGTATGLDPWSAEVLLVAGANVITFTAYDSSGNSGQDTLTVTYAAAGGTTIVEKDGKCGLLGFEALFLLALLAARRGKMNSCFR
ncbi:MAG TPA: Ig-like domain-containing protein, partial [Acidimicrobiia bacterium]|nr:Ig-like domain-containing protein [Acidimicrobiia bacterium]